MSEKSYRENIKTLTTVIYLCLKDNRFIGPGLILLYSAIDIMAWLNCPKDKKDVNREAFEKWTNKYLLTDPNLPCSATDLYAARCGMVHSFSSVSRLLREKEAREIWYARSEKSAEFLQNYIKSKKMDSIIVIEIEKLNDCLMEAIKKFDHVLLSDTKKADIVYKRADQLFGSFIHYQRPRKKEGC